MKNLSNKRNTLILASIFIISILGFVTLTLHENQNYQEKELTLSPSDSIFFNNHKQLKEELSQTVQTMASNIASPAEVAAAIKYSNYRFSNKILLNTDISKYHTPKEKALALGAIGADLIYISSFEQKSATLRPLNQIRELSNALYISQFFDFESLKDIATASVSAEEVDSLLMMSTMQINNMERELLTPQRIETGLFMVLGAWIEGMHLLNHYARSQNDETLMIRLGDQQICLTILEEWLKKFEHNNEVKEILTALQPLKQQLTSIEIKTEKIGKPQNTYDMEGNETTYQVTQTTPIINMAQEDSISEEVERFRKRIFRL
ncbi:hypothetical protein [Marinilabilia salmonicolor]|uniref:hypothetical protein n=1 Tax=Marinilabilia salmonicolor TaxID=989 RepID=UPI00029AF321|nr:hypothetical protein [Marinilabilia salmonicolor]